MAHLSPWWMQPLKNRVDPPLRPKSKRKAMTHSTTLTQMHVKRHTSAQKRAGAHTRTWQTHSTKNTKPQKLANQKAIHWERHTDIRNDNKKQCNQIIHLKQPKSQERHKENTNYCPIRRKMPQNRPKITPKSSPSAPRVTQNASNPAKMIPERPQGAQHAPILLQECPKSAPRPSKSTPKVPEESPRRSQNIKSAPFQHSMLGASISKRPDTNFNSILALIFIIPASPNFFQSIVFPWFFQCFEQQP